MMSVRALDAQFRLIKTLPYINLQWTRRYYTFGQYTVQIPLEEYEEGIKYIYTPDRPELGIVQQVSIQQTLTGDYAELSGFFIEAILNDKIIYPRYNGTGTTENISRQLVNAYKDDIPVVQGEARGLGSNITLQETGEMLGDKLYGILQMDELSYRLNYDYVNNTLTYDVWQGLDRTYAQDVNARVLFSRRVGSINELQFTYDDSAFKNYAVVAGEGEGDARKYAYVDRSNGGYKRMVFIDARDVRSDGLTPAQYTAALQQRGEQKLDSDYTIIDDFDIRINPKQSGREYLVDYDLGDKCDIDVTLKDTTLRYTARVTEAQEVIKANRWDVTITVGTKMPTDMQIMRR